VIGLLLLIGLYALYQSGNRIFRKTDANLEAVNAASIVMTVITDDFRNLTLTKKDLEGSATNHSIPIKITAGATGALDAKPSSNEPVLLSKGPFKLAITDPEGAIKDPPERKIITVEYSLKKESTPSGKDLFHLVRKTPSEERVYRESYLKEVSFQFLRTKEDPKDKGEPGPGDEQMFYVRILVVGASTSLMEGGPTGTITDQSDYYKVPLVGVYSLDCITELVTARGLGRYWRPVVPNPNPGNPPNN
jgi:hypothetical protein